METISVGENSGYSLEQRKLLGGVRYEDRSGVLNVITNDGRELKVRPMAGQSTYNAILDAINNLPSVNPEVQSLLAGGQYRDIPAGTPLTPEAIRATPIFNPNIGPQINQGYGPISAAQAGFQLNPQPGGGFSTIQSNINQAKALISNIQIPKNITGATLAPTTTPTLPEATASSAYSNYLASSTATATNARTAVEQAYQTQLDDLKAKETEAQKKIDEFTRLQKDGPIAEMERLSQPFREQLENAERERLYITENFEANQALTRELGDLLTEGNTLIAEQRSQTGLAAIRNPRIAKTIEDVSARAGVIQAVMSARSGQIAEAERMIDRSVDAINADRIDRKNYFSTLLDFYESEKSTEANKLLALTKEEKGFINAQIGLLENDLAQSQANSEYIKKLMVDPESALFMARAGVTLTDTPEKINQKLATQTARQQGENTKKALEIKGYQYVPFPTNTAGLTSQIIDGKTYWFKPPVGKTETISGVTGVSDSTTEILTNKVNLIDDLINHPGLDSRVGPNFLARRAFAVFDAFGAGQDFAAGVTQLVNKETIDTLVNLKERGGTLGALSDQERILLQSAATKIGTWEVKENGIGTGEYNIDEASFKRELQTIKELAQKALERHLGYDPTTLQEDDLLEIDAVYGVGTTTPAFDPSLFF